jgi:hypothetical protein
MSRAKLSLTVYAIYLSSAGLSIALFPDAVLPIIGLSPTREVWVRLHGALAVVLAAKGYNGAPEPLLVYAVRRLHPRGLRLLPHGARPPRHLPARPHHLRPHRLCRGGVDGMGGSRGRARRHRHEQLSRGRAGGAGTEISETRRG